MTLSVFIRFYINFIVYCIVFIVAARQNTKGKKENINIYNIKTLHKKVENKQ